MRHLANAVLVAVGVSLPLGNQSGLKPTGPSAKLCLRRLDESGHWTGPYDQRRSHLELGIQWTQCDAERDV